MDQRLDEALPSVDGMETAVIGVFTIARQSRTDESASEEDLMKRIKKLRF